MPESVAIGLIVLGGVLLLVALAGGKFKIFGAEVESSASRVSRFAAFVVGCVCVLAGIAQESGTKPEPPKNDPPVHDAGPNQPDAPAPNDEEFDPPAPPQPVSAPALPNLAGLWHDGNGTGVQIQQNGARLHFEAANLFNGQMVVGEGVLNGRQIQLTTTTNAGLVATGVGVLGAGDAIMNFTMQDMVNGRYTFGLQRIN